MVRKLNYFVCKQKLLIRPDYTASELDDRHLYTVLTAVSKANLIETSSNEDTSCYCCDRVWTADMRT